MIKPLLLFIVLLLLPMEARAELREEVKTDSKGAKIHTFYDGKAIVKVETDVNGDGKPDIVTAYKNGKRWTETGDRNLDGKPDYQKLYDSKGALLQDMQDTNGDGKWDRYYTHPTGSRDYVIKEFDRNFDGKVDRRSLAIWDANKTLIVPDGPRMTRTPMPGYRPLWSEDDNNYDGIIDAYYDRNDKTKTRVGQKIDPNFSKVNQNQTEKTEEKDKEQANKPFVSPGAQRMEELNEKNGYKS